jgi:large subunit ribosomal protein L6
MSKLAKKLIAVPQNVTVTKQNHTAVVRGPKGELRVCVPEGIEWNMESGGVRVGTDQRSKQARANIGTAWALVRNAVHGVIDGYTKTLEIEGVGFKMGVEGDSVTLSLGYMNPIKLKIPQGLTVTTDKNSLTVFGMNKELVGRFAADIRTHKKPEPYKGKGIRYRGEVIRRKAGKKATTTAS